MAAAAKICGDSDLPAATIPGLLSSLVNQSMLVHADANSGLRLLTPLRAFARTKLQDDRAEVLRRNFVEWYARWTVDTESRLRTPQEEAATAELTAEFDNIRAAHRLGLDLGEFEKSGLIVASLMTFAVHRFRFEVIEVWARASLNVGGMSDRTTAALSGIIGIRDWMRGDLSAAKLHSNAAVAIEESAGLPASIQPRLVRLAVAGYEGRFGDAAEEFRIAYDRARDLDDEFWQVEVLVFSAIGMATQGMYELATGIAERAARLASRSGVPTTLAWARYAICESTHRDDPGLAVDLLRSTIALARSVGNEWIAGLSLVSLARQLRQVGQLHQAAVALLESLDRWLRAENWSEQWRTVRQAAMVCADANRLEDAAMMFGALAHVDSIIPLSQGEVDEIDQFKVRLDEAFGHDEIARLLRRGELIRTLDPHDVVELARDALRNILNSAQLST